MPQYITICLNKLRNWNEDSESYSMSGCSYHLPTDFHLANVKLLFVVSTLKKKKMTHTKMTEAGNKKVVSKIGFLFLGG